MQFKRMVGKITREKKKKIKAYMRRKSTQRTNAFPQTQTHI